MNKWLLIIFGVIGMSFFQTAQAQDLDRAMELIEEASEITEDVMWINCENAVRRRFRQATYKLQTAEIEVESVRRRSREKNAALDAIQLMIEKINDPILSKSEKKEAQDDCSEVAYRNIERMIANGDGDTGNVGQNLQAAIEFLDDADDCTESGDYEGADRFLAQAQNILRNYRNDRSLRGSVRQVQEMREYVCHPRYSYRQKNRYISDNVQDLKRQIRRSRSYQRENRGGGWRWNQENDASNEMQLTLT